ncbi:MAG: host attachment protein [Hyphomonadaceae bacterium]|nr:MAG: Host attachment protein [Caulobacteraceae bacterium]MBT9444601.1 host attachment protein [Hyphomonadaceae bacterium]TPW04516.1 MAG: Host attachment protein [Alphaproteobacteria bacterium]
MRQKVTWVATFDGASCRAFAYAAGAQRLDEIESAHRTGAHKPSFDGPAGRVHESMGARRSGVSSPTDPERRMEDEFIAAFTGYLAEQASAGSFDALIVAAAPRALGAFREHAPKALVEKVVREIHGDHVNSERERLLEALALK